MLGAARTITRGADELLLYCAGVNCHIPCPVAKRTRSTLAGGLQTSNPRTPPRTESAADDCHDAPASFVAYSRIRAGLSQDLVALLLHTRAAKREGQWRDQPSAHRFLHERADLCLVGGGQLLQREGDRPHGAFVEVRLVAEAERRVPRLELLRALEEADDLAVLGIRGHSVPESRREGWRAGFDDGMERLAHGAIRFRHPGDLREHSAFPVRLARALQLLDALLHRDSFLVRESLELLADRGGALGGLLRFLLWAHRNVLTLIYVR